MRLTAQDPAHGLRPTPGRLTRWRPAPIGGVRLDSHCYEGYLFPPYYDALMAKIIVAGADRAAALALAAEAVRRLEVEGPTTNRELLSRLIAHPDVATNIITTRWLEEQFDEGRLP